MKFFVGIVLFCLSFTSFGQAEKWSLERCINYALEHNLSIQDQMFFGQQQDIGLGRSQMAYWPSLNSSMSQNINFGRAIDPFTNQYINRRFQSTSFSLTSSVTIYNGFRLRNNVRLNESSVEKAAYDMQVLKNDISQNVTVAFLNVIFAENALTRAKQQDSTTRIQIIRVKKLVDGGVLNKGELFNLEAQSANDQVVIRRSEGDLRTSYVDLMQLLQLDYSLPFEIEIPTFELIPTTIQSDMNVVLEKSLQELPNIKSAEEEILRNTLSRDIARAGLQPRVSAFGNLNTLYSENNIINAAPVSFGQQLSDNFGQGVGLSVSVPIFNNSAVKSDVSTADISIERSKILLEMSKNQIRSMITNAYTNQENALATYISALENEKAQRGNYNFSEARFNNGLITSAEMVQARNNWQSALMQVDRSKYELIFARAQVNFYRSGKIELQ
jgi:outer membrane protein